MSAAEPGTLAIVRALPALLGTARPVVNGVYTIGEELEELGDEELGAALEQLGFWWLIPRAIKAARGGQQRGGARGARGPRRAARGARPASSSGRRPFAFPWFRVRGEDLAALEELGDEELGAELEALGFDPLAYMDQKRAELLAEVDARVAQVQTGIQAAASGAYGTAKGVLADARDGLWSSYRMAVQNGSEAAADAIKLLAQRAGDAWASLGQGAGAAFRSFWGLSPAEGIGGILTLGAVLMLAFGAGALYLYTTPGGQSYLASLGAGVGRGIGEMGAGYGGAARELGRGAGAGLARVDLGNILGAVL